MTAAALLAALTARGVALAVAPDGRLSWSAPRGVLTAEDRAVLLEHRDEVLHLLALRACGVDRRPLLWHKVDAVSVRVVAPAPGPPPGAPSTCPRCRSASPRWARLSVPGRVLCGRCWRGFDLADAEAAKEDLR